MMLGVGIGCKTCAEQHEDCSATECYPMLTCLAYDDCQGTPTETCEIPCVDDQDCPSSQTCNDLTPGPGMVCIECIWEGGTTGDPDLCCDDLTAMTGCVPGEDCDLYFCANCGDGICGENETPWECPADCRDCSTMGISDDECAGYLVQSWANAHRQKTADELAAMTFADRAEAIAEKSWYGQVPGSSTFSFHDDGALRLAIGAPLTSDMLGLASVPSDAQEMADDFVDDFGGLVLGLDADHGDLESSIRPDANTDSEVVIYRQTFNGVRVISGDLYVTVNGSMKIMEIGNNLLPSISHGATPDITIDEATRAIASFEGVQNVGATKNEIFIVRGLEDRTASMLVYEIAAIDTDTGRQIGVFRVDAITGYVLEKHRLDWRWPQYYDVLPDTAPTEHYVKLYLVDIDYDDAYNCVGGYCDLTGTNYDETIATNSQSAVETEVWSGGTNWDPVLDGNSDWDQPSSTQSELDPPEFKQLRPIAYLVEELIWPYLEIEGLSDDGVMGSATGGPMGMHTRTKMAAQTVAFKSGVTKDLYFVEGGFDTRTFAHEFGHRTGDSTIGYQTAPKHDWGLEGNCLA